MNRLFISIIVFIMQLTVCWADNYSAFFNVTMPRDVNVTMIACIRQDSTGLMWIGTNCGLFSYDGYTMIYHSQKVCGDHVHCMEDVTNDALYIGTDHGLWAYDYKNADFREWIEGSPNEIRSMVRDGDILWLGSSNGLYSYHLQTKQIKKYGGDKLGNEIIYALLKASDGNVYIGTYNGLYYYDKQRGHFRNINLPLLPRNSNMFVNTLLEDANRKCIWIGTGGRLYKYGMNTNLLERVSELDDNSIKSFELDNDGRLLIGTDNGLYVYQDNEYIYKIHHDSSDPSSLINDVVWCINNDIDGNVWVGTDEGISITREKREVSFIPVSLITRKRTGNHFYHVFQDRNDNLWLGGTEGLIRTTPQFSEAVWYSVDNHFTQIMHNRIRRIYEDHDGDLWICTDGGVHLWDKGQWRHINIEDPKTKRNANWAYDICQDKQGRMWIAAYMGGLFIVDKNKLVASQGDCQADKNIIFDDGKGLKPFQIVEVGENDLWVLYYDDGIRKVNLRTMKVERERKIEEITGNEIPNRMFVDSHNRLWICLQGRILYGINDNFKLINLGYQSGSDISWIEEVQNCIWLGTKTDIWEVDTAKARLIGAISGQVDAVCYDRSNQRIWGGTVDGLFCGSPEDYTMQYARHPIRLTGVYVDNHLARSLSFAPDERHLVFAVSDFPYAQVEKSQFLYRLKGIDLDWNALSKGTNSIAFNNLQYGSYLLEVSRLGPSGSPEDIIVIPFKIRYPWYLSWWAYTLYFILGGGFIGWCFHFYSIRNRLRYERLEKEHIIEQIQLKMDFLSKLSEDLKNPIGKILSPITRMLSETHDVTVRQQMQQVQDEVKELSVKVTQIADFNQTSSVEPAALVTEEIEQLTPADEKFLSEITNIIEKHIADSDLNVNYLCEQIGFGNKLVYRKLKQLTGRTPVEYIRSIRLNKAATLLKQKKFTISEVMYLSGFNNASYFSKCFFSEYGFTPRDYMEQS